MRQTATIEPAPLKLVRMANASVWLVFGLVFKVMGLIPRHELIVAAVLGHAVAGAMVVSVGLAEAALGVWILSRIRPRLCAIVQTVAIVAMNSLELLLARDLLLAPGPMVFANVLFLGTAWWVALATERNG